MGSVNDIGVPGAPLSQPPLTAWQAAVRDVVSGSDVTVDQRIADAIAAIPPPPPGVDKLDDLSDVTAPAPVPDAYVLTYDEGTAQWTAQPLPSGGATTLDELTDVTAPTPIVDGYVLTWDETTAQWLALPPPAGTGGGGATILDELADVAVPAPLDGDGLMYEGVYPTGLWVNAPAWGRWTGTQAEYDALGTYDPAVLYVVTG